MENLEDYMTIADICAQEKISDSTARRRITNHIPKFRKLGIVPMLYLKSDVEKRVQEIGLREYPSTVK